MVQNYFYTGVLKNEFLPMMNFLGGVDISPIDLGKNNGVVTAAGIGGGPHVRIFEQFGVLRDEFFAQNIAFGDGVIAAAGTFAHQSTNNALPEIVVMPQSTAAHERSDAKYIEVDISQQTLTLYDHGHFVNEFLVSTGKAPFATPLGEYDVWRKRPLVRMSWYYGPNNPYNYDLPDVPWVLSFQGAFTIHGTYWHKNFGTPMSHGCVNMYTPDANWVYHWSPMKTPVVVRQ